MIIHSVRLRSEKLICKMFGRRDITLYLFILLAGKILQNILDLNGNGSAVRSPGFRRPVSLNSGLLEADRPAISSSDSKFIKVCFLVIVIAFLVVYLMVRIGHPRTILSDGRSIWSGPYR